jgi:hypothetical protein
LQTETAKGKAQPKDRTASKQATLFSLKGAPSKESIELEAHNPKKANSGNTPIETAEEADEEQSNDEPVSPAPQMDEDLEETQLEETQVLETPQPLTEEPAAMDDDEEPLEWEESDRE